MKVAVVGANGQLGADLVEIFSSGHDVTGLTHADIEITNIDSVRKVLPSIKPDILINTAAYNKVPDAEINSAEAFQINAAGPLNLAKICTEENIRFIQYSTDYVFDGRKNSPYTEKNLPNPLNVYGNTKLSGEYFSLNYCDRSFVVRVSGIYGKIPSRSKGNNFITSILKAAKEKPEVKVVNDEVLTPTPTKWIAKNTLALAQTEAYGLYHMSCDGAVSWYEFAKTIWDELKIKTPLHPSSVNDFPQNVKRPFYSVLENHNLKSLGIDQMPDWKKALVEFLKENKNYF
ncbi:MAG: dTDP-4-dehydrorhamnose reductase [Sphingobacteriales bacterium UTBCD1]|jgi:dTDP-4-dehydrorhamnose reductase|nr:MAG: dTDP-4-dehydrorhamnose reductase [Sphingobacteriales bacterium UTBCD1]